MWDLLALSLLRVRTTLTRNFLFKERTVIPILEYKCCYINNYSEIFQVFFFFLVIYGILNQSNEQKLIQSGIKFSQKKIMQLFSALIYPASVDFSSKYVAQICPVLLNSIPFSISVLLPLDWNPSWHTSQGKCFLLHTPCYFVFLKLAFVSYC